MKVSIVIPVYQAQRWLEVCLDSVLNQSFRDFEAVLVNDGSTDGSGEICRRYAAADARFRVLEQKNKGTVIARLVGVEAAIGERIFFLDSDDWLDPDALYRMNEIAEQYDPDLVVSVLTAEWENYSRPLRHGIAAGNYSGRQLQEKVWPYMISSGTFYNNGIRPEGCGKLFRKKLLQPCMKRVDPQITLGDDFAFVYPYILSADSIFIMEEEASFYHYRKTGKGLTRQEGIDLYERMRPFYGYLERLWAGNSQLLHQLEEHKLFYCKIEMERVFDPGIKTPLRKRILQLGRICSRWKLEELVRPAECSGDHFFWLDKKILRSCLKNRYGCAGIWILLQKLVRKLRR